VEYRERLAVIGVWSEESCSLGKTVTTGEEKLSEENIKLIIELLRALLKGKCVGMPGIEARLRPRYEAVSTSNTSKLA
jgi:hypothetical protein